MIDYSSGLRIPSYQKRDMELCVISSHLLCFKPVLRIKIWYVFIGLALGLVFYIWWRMLSAQVEVFYGFFKGEGVLFVISCPACIFLYIFIYRFYFYKRFFDFENNFYYIVNIDNNKNKVVLDSVKGILVVEESVQFGIQSYKTYEMKLILLDGSRIHLIKHSEIYWIRKEAEFLAKRLDINVEGAGFD